MFQFPLTYENTYLGICVSSYTGPDPFYLDGNNSGVDYIDNSSAKFWGEGFHIAMGY